MAPSHISNCRRNTIKFTAKFDIFLSLLLLLLRLTLAQYDTYNRSFSECGQDNILHRSALERNLKVVLNSLVENVGETGYNISSYGENGDKIYGLVQCRGDLNASACQTCTSRAGDSLRQICNGTSGSIHLGLCFLKYATHSPDSSLSSFGNFSGLCNESKSENAGGFSWRIANLLTRLVEKTESSMVGYSTLSDYGVYSLAECWRDLTRSRCSQCLNTIYTHLNVCSVGTNKGTVLNGYCMIQFTEHKFYSDHVPLLSPPNGPSPETEGKGGPKLLGLSMGGAVLIVVLLGVVLIWKREAIKATYKKQLPGHYEESSELSTAISKSKLNYKFQILRNATQNFNLKNKIGEGGFGSVYKGILPNGIEIAVKRIFINREQGMSEFFNEVNLISRVQHKNLVKLLGCSVNGPERLLVYEYLSNKSLDLFLFDEKMRKVLDWQRRFEIILGIASGLAYLHQESDIRIIHRDIKSSNILLDQNFKPKIADFGLVKYFAEDQSHLSTRIIGTRGYMAPEYLVHGHLTEKVDVYGFGVLVLEIVSGIKNKPPMHTNDIPPLLTMVWNHYLSGTILNIIDPNIHEDYQEGVLQVVHIALLCTQASATLRPSMSKVIMFLTSKEPNLIKPTEPPFVGGIHSESSTSVTSIHSP